MCGQIGRGGQGVQTGGRGWEHSPSLFESPFLGPESHSWSPSPIPRDPPGLFFLGQGQGGRRVRVLVGAAPPPGLAAGGRKEGEGRRVRDPEGGARGKPGSPGLWGPPRLAPPLSCRLSSGPELRAAGLRRACTLCPRRGPPRPNRPSRPRGRPSPSLPRAARSAQGRRRRRVLLPSLPLQPSEPEGPARGREKGGRGGERKREREGGSEAGERAPSLLGQRPPRSRPLAWSEETRSPPPPEPGPALSSPPARRCPRGRDAVARSAAGYSRGKAAGPCHLPRGALSP